MALGKRKTERQEDLFLTAAELPKAPGHVFYRKLNELLAEGAFDPWAEKLCEPCYAVCETGGARRTWLWGIDKVRKRYLIAAAAHNLGVLMRKLFGIGTPRGLQAFADLALALYLAILRLLRRLTTRSRCVARKPTASTLSLAAA